MRVYQIYFDESQKKELVYEPYFNSECTVFFENSVIRELIESGRHKDSDYFGVVSYQLKSKIGIMKNRMALKNIANHSEREFNKDVFESILYSHKPDVMSFQRHPPHDPIALANRFHPNFSKLFTAIMNKIGYDFKSVVFDDVIYCNYFVAKSDIYEKYCKEMLLPAMDVMAEMPELMQNSGYPKKLPENLKIKFGVDYYPYHSFVCERMFSYFAHINKLNCLHY